MHIIFILNFFLFLFIMSFIQQTFHQMPPAALKAKRAKPAKQFKSVSPHSSSNNSSYDSFSFSMSSFFHFCSSSSSSHFEIFKLLSAHGFRRRRFYDVVNVLETLGICSKINSETLVWNGMGNVKHAIENLAKKHGAFNQNKTMEDIIPYISTITITSMTEFFIISFIALERQNLDIKEVAYFISRVNGRAKTTLCKLYQIAQILQIVGVITKTEKKSQFRMSDNYFIPASKKFNSIGFMEIGNLLSRPSFNANQNVIERRNAEYKSAVNYFLSSSDES